MTNTNNVPGTAYELLTRPTLTLTDAEVEAIVTELRLKRIAYVNSAGKAKDDPRPKVKPTPTSLAAKKANTLDILAGLDINLDDV